MVTVYLELNPQASTDRLELRITLAKLESLGCRLAVVAAGTGSTIDCHSPSSNSILTQQNTLAFPEHRLSPIYAVWLCKQPLVFLILSGRFLISDTDTAIGGIVTIGLNRLTQRNIRHSRRKISPFLLLVSRRQLDSTRRFVV